MIFKDAEVNTLTLIDAKDIKKDLEALGIDAILSVEDKQCWIDDNAIFIAHQMITFKTPQDLNYYRLVGKFKENDLLLKFELA